MLRPPSCEYNTTFDALRLTRWDAVNGARARQQPSYWRLNPCDFKDPNSLGSTRACRTDRTCAATRRRAGLNNLSQCLSHWLPARDNQASGPGDKTFSSLQSLRCTSQDMRSENYCTSPSLLRTTRQSASVRQPRQSTASESIETPKVKNPDPILHLIQHHVALLHASSRGNECIGSSDLLDSGDWAPRSLHHQLCTGRQRGAHPWGHNDGPHGHSHKSCNQQPTIRSTQMPKPNMRLAPRLN